MENASKRKVFISYSSDMYDTTVLASSELNKYGIDTWIDRASIPKGTDGWADAIDRGILSSDLVVVLLNRASAIASYVTYEWSYALGAGKTVIGVRFEECDIHPRLKNTQLFMNEFLNGQRPWNLLADAITSIDLGEEFRLKLREFLSLSDAVLGRNTISDNAVFSDDDYHAIAECGNILLKSYSTSSTPIKAHYMSDINCFKLRYFNFCNRNWILHSAEPVLDVREMNLIAAYMLE